MSSHHTMAKKKGGAKGNATTNAPAKKAGALSEADQAAIAAKIAALSAGEQAAAAAVAGLYAGTPEERATAAAALAAATKADKKGAVFVYAIVAYSNPETEVTLVDKLKDMLSGADANARAGALVGIAAVANEMGHSVEPFMLIHATSSPECPRVLCRQAEVCQGRGRRGWQGPTGDHVSIRCQVRPQHAL